MHNTKIEVLLFSPIIDPYIITQRQLHWIFSDMMGHNHTRYKLCCCIAESTVVLIDLPRRKVAKRLNKIVQVVP